MYLNSRYISARGDVRFTINRYGVEPLATASTHAFGSQVPCHFTEVFHVVDWDSEEREWVEDFQFRPSQRPIPCASWIRRTERRVESFYALCWNGRYNVLSRFCDHPLSQADGW
jgi:hypothetical protein